MYLWLLSWSLCVFVEHKNWFPVHMLIQQQTICNFNFSARCGPPISLPLRHRLFLSLFRRFYLGVISFSFRLVHLCFFPPCLSAEILIVCPGRNCLPQFRGCVCECVSCRYTCTHQGKTVGVDRSVPLS